MAVAKLDVIEQYTDNSANALAGGSIETYVAGTLTALATYSDSTGTTPHANPITLDSSGRPPGDGIFFTVGSSYKVIIKDASGNVLETVDGVGPTSTSVVSNTFVDIVWFFADGPPTATDLLYGERVARAITIPANFSGAYGWVYTTNPASSFVITVKKNASTVGTITISTAGAFTFATSGGASISLIAGDYIEFYGPNPADTQIADFGITIPGAV